MSTGSLGQGISAAIGMALANRLDKIDSKVYLIIGDGESNEGQNWEGAMAAAHCRERNVDIAKLAVQFAVSEPRIHTTLVGTASVENIRKNVSWIQEPLDEELLGEVREILRPIRDCTWIVGRPENSGGVRGYDAKYCSGETP